MSAIVAYTLSDATPTAHTFDPIEAQPRKSAWQETTVVDQPYLRSNVVATHRPSLKQGETTKTVYRLNVPLFDTVDGLVVTRGTIRIVTDVIFPSDSTDTEKDDALAMNADLVAEAVFQAHCKGQPPY